MKNRKYLFILGLFWFFLGCVFLFWGANKLLFYGFVLNEQLYILSQLESLYIPFEASFFILITICFLFGNFLYNRAFKKVIARSANIIRGEKEPLFILDGKLFSFWMLTVLMIFLALLVRNFFDQFDIIAIGDITVGAIFFRGSLEYLKSIFIAVKS